MVIWVQLAQQVLREKQVQHQPYQDRQGLREVKVQLAPLAPRGKQALTQL